jgi:ankyrin repeat protein
MVSQTVFQIAATGFSEGNRELVEFLLEMGAPVNVTDERGWSPLESAAYFCKKDIVVLLMSHGAKPNYTTFDLASRSNGHHPTDGWCYPREIEVLETLLQNSGIHDAARWGCLKRVKELLEENPGLISSRDAEGKTPLHHAMQTRNGYEEVIEFLVSNGADADSKDNKGMPPQPYYSGHREALMKSLARRRGAATV